MDLSETHGLVLMTRAGEMQAGSAAVEAGNSSFQRAVIGPNEWLYLTSFSDNT